MRKAWIVALIVSLLVLATAGGGFLYWLSRPAWSDAELVTLRSLALASLPPLPPDPSNVVADDSRAAALGHHLFFDSRFSGNGAVSCATCHDPARFFTDGRPLGVGVGVIPRHTMSLLGASYHDWFTWDGKADSQWAQALIPLENPRSTAAIACNLPTSLPRTTGANTKRSSARCRTWQIPRAFRPRGARHRPTPASRLGRHGAGRSRSGQPHLREHRQGAGGLSAAAAAGAGAVRPLCGRVGCRARWPGGAASPDEIAGLRLFIGKAQCINCHNGPLLANGEFHNTAIPGVPGLPLDRGRAAGIERLVADPFNCLGPSSDAEPEQCSQLRFLVTEGQMLEGSFKTPTLRNVAQTAPYMHAGQFATLAEVLTHYNEGGWRSWGTTSWRRSI